MTDHGNLKTILDRATQEINKGNGASVRGFQHLEAFQPRQQAHAGEIYADRIREHAEETARAVEAQAEVILTRATIQMEEAKRRAERAKEIAESIRNTGEEDARMAIDLDNRLGESAELLAAIGNKFEAT